MKYLLLLLFCSSLQAKEFVLSYNVNGDVLEPKVQADSPEDAMIKASDICFDYFINKQPKSDDYGLYVIDVCANPRSPK
jgi:hypothetical protein